jgi:dynactin 4
VFRPSNSREADLGSKFNVLVSYTYRADDPTEETGSSAAPKTAVTGGGENKTFSFYIVVDLGTISPAS